MNLSQYRKRRSWMTINCQCGTAMGKTNRILGCNTAFTLIQDEVPFPNKRPKSFFYIQVLAWPRHSLTGMTYVAGRCVWQGKFRGGHMRGVAWKRLHSMGGHVEERRDLQCAACGECKGELIAWLLLPFPQPQAFVSPPHPMLLSLSFSSGPSDPDSAGIWDAAAPAVWPSRDRTRARARIPAANYLRARVRASVNRGGEEEEGL